MKAFVSLLSIVLLAFFDYNLEELPKALKRVRAERCHLF